MQSFCLDSLGILGETTSTNENVGKYDVIYRNGRRTFAREVLCTGPFCVPHSLIFRQLLTYVEIPLFH